EFTHKLMIKCLIHAINTNQIKLATYLCDSVQLSDPTLIDFIEETKPYDILYTIFHKINLRVLVSNCFLEKDQHIELLRMAFPKYSEKDLVELHIERFFFYALKKNISFEEVKSLIEENF